MINRFFYQSSISDFLSSSVDIIFGQMSRADEMDTAATQKYAWEQEISIMKKVLVPFKNEEAWILFEYSIPRLGKRVDVVVLLRERIFVIEFKAGETDFLHQDVDQVMDYVLDLKNFHQGSNDRRIVPILVATESNQHSTVCQLSHYDDGVYEPLLTDSLHLGEIMDLVLSDNIPTGSYKVALCDWARSRYSPTPTIIEAARSLYLNHSVKDITRHEAEGICTASDT